ncbi:MAG: metalloregulator ArsR/SmtB family transcription factor [Sulfitobacter sp.]|jgi:ArsR family transcriptional regulator, virulence genes transcriptional regulator|uniref:metalloregulator ArsR/SmtB family transcription factor n=1 Tax=Sulfitobacter sp. TaxID=1903071 RepID=UPI000C66F835|nr:transcriptional regulator [Roseobacter sp.]MBV50281.1 transcriptional regulator [Roseobacter sp.]THF73433.1 MAG: helix-turn-helix transcriptional regulator [Sulfitobacter sp. SK025]|tara:strand:- start:8759 stop:9094 length:336 start_codon:yes stop_codon:yes gene_type:complete
MSNLVNTNIKESKLPLAVLQSRAIEVSEHLALLSNANRLMVLCHLLDGEQSVGSLQAQLNLSQSALSQHLAKLRDAGMVATRRERQTIFYRIADTRVQRMIDALYSIYCAP